MTHLFHMLLALQKEYGTYNVIFSVNRESNSTSEDVLQRPFDKISNVLTGESTFPVANPGFPRTLAT